MFEPSDARVLIVDDNPIDRSLLVENLEPEGYNLDLANDGAEAWEILQRNPDAYDVLLLDRVMPRMGGIALLGKIKEHPHLQTLPVIMQTAASARDEILEGINAGAYYYLTKPYDREMLKSIVRTAASDHATFKALRGTLRKGLGSLALLRNARFVFRTVEHARDLAATLANTCPDPERSVIGLTELLVNAVEHGNLGITYDEKSALNAKGQWWEEVTRRLASAEYRDKTAEVTFERDDTAIRFTVRDQGNGFNWQKYLQIDPARAFHTHGRGIAMANLYTFDKLEYRGNGNEVVGTIELDRGDADR